MSESQEFRAPVLQDRKRVLIRVPFDPQATWGAKSRHYVKGTVNGVKIRALLGADGEDYFVPLGPAWLRESGVKPGDEVSVSLSAEGPQQGAQSEDVVAALSEEPEAAAFFNGLATFYRKGYINWIESAKRPDTRARRIEETIRLLRAGKKQR
jgi:hypothetical protein